MSSDNKHPIQILLEQRADAARIAEEEAALEEQRYEEAWKALAVLMDEAVQRANAVLSQNKIVDRFRFHPPTATTKLVFELLDHGRGKRWDIGLVIDLDPPENFHVRTSDTTKVPAADFARLDQFLADIYDYYTSD